MKQATSIEVQAKAGLLVPLEGQRGFYPQSTYKRVAHSRYIRRRIAAGELVVKRPAKSRNKE